MNLFKHNEQTTNEFMNYHRAVLSYFLGLAEGFERFRPESLILHKISTLGSTPWFCLIYSLGLNCLSLISSQAKRKMISPYIADNADPYHDPSSS